MKAHKHKPTPLRAKKPTRRRRELLACGCPVPTHTVDWLNSETAPCLCCWSCGKHCYLMHAAQEVATRVYADILPEVDLRPYEMRAGWSLASAS